jgi:hypothetical protein
MRDVSCEISREMKIVSPENKSREISPGFERFLVELGKRPGRSLRLRRTTRRTMEAIFERK